MTPLRIRAHFDGKSFVPEDTVDLPSRTMVFLAVRVPDISTAKEMTDEEWDQLALRAFEAAAYGDDEPDYDEADLIEKLSP